MSAAKPLVDGTPVDAGRTDDAEEGVLSAILIEWTLAERQKIALALASRLEPDDFARTAHARTFSAMRVLDARASIVDPVTLKEELEQRGELAAVGGVEVLEHLLNVMPTSANIAYHVAIVRDHGQRRRAARKLDDAATLLRGGLRSPTDVAGDVRLVLDAMEEGAGAPAFDTVRVLEGEAPEPPGMLVRDLLLDRDVNLWAGFGGSAKSTVALTVAVCVALGRPAFGTLAVDRSGPVLLVVPEDGEAAVRMMLDAIAAGMALSPEERAMLTERIVMVREDVRVNLLVDTAKLAQTARAHGAVLVEIDPLGSVLGDEDVIDNRVAAAAVDALRRDVCRGADAAVLVSAHNRKPAKEAEADAPASRHDVKGAAGWADSARLVFAVAKTKDDLTLSCVKANRVRADLKHELRLAIDAEPVNSALWRSCAITDRNAGATSEALTPGVGRRLTEHERRAIEAVDDRDEPGCRFSWSEWRVGSGRNENTLKTVKKRFAKDGLVDAIPTGRKRRNGSVEYSYCITGIGRSALAFDPNSDYARGEGVRRGEEGCAGRAREGCEHTPHTPVGGVGAPHPSQFPPSPLTLPLTPLLGTADEHSEESP